MIVAQIIAVEERRREVIAEMARAERDAVYFCLGLLVERGLA